MAHTYLRLASLASLGLIVAASLGCGSEPIPRVAVAGTTITIAIPRSYETGYGTASTGGDFNSGLAYDPASPREDPQRGEMVFDLVDSSDTHVAYLPVRYITRLVPSELSPFAQASGDPLQVRSLGQALAMIDIPATVPAANDYKIKLTRYVRDETSFPDHPFQAQQEDIGGSTDWFGWGNDVTPGDPSGIPIQIVGALNGNEEHFTDYTGWGDFQGNLGHTDVESDLLDAIPYPSVSFAVYYEVGGNPVSPNAWETEIQYPRKKVAIRGVGLAHNRPSNALAQFQVLNPIEPTDCNDGGDFDTLRIQLVDPEAQAQNAGVRIAFEVLNFHDPACGGSVQPGDFVADLAKTKAYDIDGVLHDPPIAMALEIR